MYFCLFVFFPLSLSQSLYVHNIVFLVAIFARFRTTLYVRNNLTTLHPVELNGHGGSSRLVFPEGVLAAWHKRRSTYCGELCPKG